MSKHTNHSTNEPENLHVIQFSSELVHRHIIYSLTLLNSFFFFFFLKKQNSLAIAPMTLKFRK